jgi:hypothetical protein
MGGFEHSVAGPGRPGGPVINISGVALMGGVEITRKSPKGPKGPKKDKRDKLKYRQPGELE